ncbi:MAG: hypothetical protein V4644_00210 [Patescibacteria group bacterium]
MTATALSAIALGTVLMSEHHGTGFRTDRLDPLFRVLSGSELTELAPGTPIYLAIDPAHYDGTLSGRMKAEIRSVTPKNGEYLWVEYEIDRHRSVGRRIARASPETIVQVARDEQELIALLSTIPEAVRASPWQAEPLT